MSGRALDALAHHASQVGGLVLREPRLLTEELPRDMRADSQTTVVTG